MIDRYSTEEMKKLWSDETKFRLWFKVELGAMKAMEKYAIIPRGEARKLEKAVKSISPERIREIEKKTGHDVIAFLTHIEEIAGAAARYLHFGMTSSDVLDTAFALQLKQASGIIIEELNGLLTSLRTKAMENKATPLVGRTHGIHASPMRLGLVFALWFKEIERNQKRIKQAQSETSFGKLSGAVGTYLHHRPEVEWYAMKLLGLKPEPISNQIVQRDRHGFFFSVLAVCGGTIEKIATNIRNFQRTEVSELLEPFGSTQKGSSAMPHKRNPILSENLCGLSRLLRSYCIASLENMALWHERDISHSCVERVIAPDATTVCHFMIRRLRKIIDGMEISKEKLIENINLTRGLIYSESIMNELIKSRMKRQEAYELVQRAAFTSRRKGINFVDVCLENKEIAGRVGKRKIKSIFSRPVSLKTINKIYERVFENEKGRN